jgi:hypothetical protein
MYVGALTYVAGGPALRLVHDHPWQALGSLGLRGGLPTLGGAIGLSMAGRSRRGYDRRDGDRRRLPGVRGGSESRPCTGSCELGAGALARRPPRAALDWQLLTPRVGSLARGARPSAGPGITSVERRNLPGAPRGRRAMLVRLPVRGRQPLRHHPGHRHGRSSKTASAVRTAKNVSAVVARTASAASAT